MGNKYNQDYRGNNYITFLGGAQIYNGDYSGSSFRPGGGLGYGFSIAPSSISIVVSEFNN